MPFMDFYIDRYFVLVLFIVFSVVVIVSFISVFLLAFQSTVLIKLELS